jgi:RNA polymerase sigma-70 factor (ECF subfamily)
MSSEGVLASSMTDHPPRKSGEPAGPGEPGEDDELILRVAAGDREAFARLYRRYRGDIHRFAAHMCGSAAAADDILQDVFVAVIEDASRYQLGRSGVLPWLLGIARNHVRRWRSQRATLPLPDAESVAGQELAVRPDPVIDISARRDTTALRRALVELPLRYREAIVLCDLQELSYVDAADALRCAVGTVRSRLHRGRALLARRLSEDENAMICRLPAPRTIA